MKLTDGWCENNFNKQSQWCHNGKLIQTPDKCPSRPRPGCWCESLKICPSVRAMWPMGPPVRVTIVQSISPHRAQQSLQRGEAVYSNKTQLPLGNTNGNMELKTSQFCILCFGLMNFVIRKFCRDASCLYWKIIFKQELPAALFDLKIDDLCPLKREAAARDPDSQSLSTDSHHRELPAWPDTSAATIGQITVTSFTCYWPENAATSKCWIAKHNNILLAYHAVTIHFNVLLSTQVIPALRRVLWATQNWKVFCIKVMFFVSSIKVIPFVGKQIYTETKL